MRPVVRKMTDQMLTRLGAAIGLGDLPKHYLPSMRDAVTPAEVTRFLFKRTFPIWQALGLYVVPRHFYEPIPDTTKLRDSLWERHSELAGIDINEEGQFDLLARFAARYRCEYDRLPMHKPASPHHYYVRNHRFSSIDGEILYSMIRHFKPRRIFEAGSGYSTYLAAQAVLRNRAVDGVECQLTVCDPHPNAAVKRGFPGLSRLLQKNVQDVPIAEFERLEENDILFIDSSHVLTIGGDVSYEYLEILPRLRKGVVVHVHDIFLPAEYPKVWVKQYYRFWNEQYLLQAFLAFNRSFEVLWAGNYMHLRWPDRLEQAFGSYDRAVDRPSSFWMRRVS